ncbi:hypothetical protein BE20_10965 [Sorangium cellulosum]|uniref:DUF7151 domain-containing protein n=1 Tax=Sorangium cellulosum TaxID=56 RepID=A0A150T5W8_SORCE|nr:hypothetical protein BE20_10965 [Sorangium cellulosum]KYF99847.1 hypothetical protein BE18_46140 [Sorangium cellulosum]
MLALIAPAACGGESDPPAPIERQLEVVVRTDAASEAQCPHGGSVVHAGLDRNENGALDEDEIAESTLQCQDEDVAPDDDTPGDPPETLVRVDDEPAGEACADGGAAVRSGPDENGNGVLDEEEVAATEYICDDALLTQMVAEPPGERCASDGIAFQVGRDVDGDGELGDEEVEWTEVECSDVIQRDVAVTSAEDLALLADIRAIHGALSIRDTSLASVELPALAHVGGHLTVSGNSALASLSLPALAAVGGRLDVHDNAELARMDLTGLVQIGGELHLSENPALAAIDLPALRKVDDEIVVRGNAALEAIELRMFDRLDDVDIQGNASLTDVVVRVSPLRDLSTQAGRVTLLDNPKLASAELAADSFHGINVVRNASLQKITIESDRIIGDVNVQEAPALDVAWLLVPTDSFADHLEIGGTLHVAAPISSLWFGIEQSGLVAGGLVLEGTHIERFERSVEHVRGDVTFRRNPNLGYFQVKQVDGGLTLDDNDALGNFDVRDDGHFGGDVYVVGNDRLQHMTGLQWTRSVGGDLTISGNASLIRPAMYDLQYVGGNVTIGGNPALEHIDLGTLRRIEGTLTVSGTAMTVWSGLDELQSIGETAVIGGNPNLENIDLLALQRTGGLFAIRENSQLQRLSLDALRYASLHITDNPLLPACAVDALFEAVTGSHRQEGNGERCP